MTTRLPTAWLLVATLGSVLPTAAMAAAEAQVTANVQVPLTVTLSLQRCAQAKPAIHTLNIDVQRSAGRPPVTGPLQVSLSASGTVQLQGTHRWQLPAKGASHLQRLCARFAVAGPGEGSVTATVTELDAAGQPLWAPQDTLFVLQRHGQMISGKSSPLELWRSALGRDLATRRITQAEHDRALRQLLETGKPDLDRH